MDEVIPFLGARSQLPLRAPSSIVLEIPLTGEKTFSWEPKQRDAAEVEVRARILAATGLVLGQIPIVRMLWAIGHGKSVWTEPPPNQPIIVGSPTLPFTLPARGVCTRLSTRELQVTFRFQGLLSGVAPVGSSVKVEISCQPVLCSTRPTLIHELGAFPVAGVIQPFPVEASEWRLSDDIGLPLLLGAVAVIPVGIYGALLGVADGSAYADWRPIPHDAIGWVGSAVHYAQFR